MLLSGELVNEELVNKIDELTEAAQGYSGWRDNRKDPGNWEMLTPPVAEITSERIRTFGRIKFDVPLFW